MGDAEQGQAARDTPPNNDVSWGFRLLGRILATLGAAGMFVLGLLTMIGFSGQCILAGLLMLVFGASIILIEAPLFCQYFSWAEKFTQFVDNRPYFLRAGLYLILSIIPFALCMEFSSFFGCGGVFVAGTFYGVIAVGKKGDAVKAAASTHIAGGKPPGGEYSNLVNQ